MAPISKSIIENNLLKKGFRYTDKSHHRYFYFYLDEKKYPVSTRLSRSSYQKDYDDNLLSKMKQQLKFDNRNQLIDFLTCPFSEQDYINHLRRKDII